MKAAVVQLLQQPQGRHESLATWLLGGGEPTRSGGSRWSLQTPNKVLKGQNGELWQLSGQDAVVLQGLRLCLFQQEGNLLA